MIKIQCLWRSFTVYQNHCSVLLLLLLFVLALTLCARGRELISASLQDGCTALHAAVRSGQVDTLRVLLCHPTQGDPTVTPEPPATLTLPAALLNQANNDGWTAAHMAAALGLKVVVFFI